MVVVSEAEKIRKRNPNPKGRMRTLSQKFVCNLKKSKATSIVVQLTHCVQNSLEMDIIRAMMNLHQYHSSLVNRGGVFNPKGVIF